MEQRNTDWYSLTLRMRRLELWVRLSVGSWLLVIGTGAFWLVTSQTLAQEQALKPSVLRVTELVVMDKKGVERVRIGGDLPDALIGGKRIPRGQQAAGILLYDASGGERSGYVTFEPSGNVGLTLDSKTSQVASFVASAESNASAFSLWNGKDMIELRSDGEGSRLTGVRNGQVVVQEPVVKKMSIDMCGAYKDALSRVSAVQVMSDCQRRFTQDACKTCLKK